LDLLEREEKTGNFPTGPNGVFLFVLNNIPVRRLIAALDRGEAAFLSIQGIQSGNELPHSTELVGASPSSASST
jgi:hypothetical protein